MPKESSLEFKKRVMDKISPTFCAAKWNNATIWLDSGQTTSCHHPPAHPIVIKEIIKNPAAIHNTSQKTQDRIQMLKGEKPSGCEYCWKIEDMGPEFVSDRVFKTNIYTEDNLRELSEIDPNQDVDLKTLEISFDRKCNFACCYCNPNFSTQWAQDIKKNGPYQNLQDVGSSDYQSDYDSLFPYENSAINPYIISFWKWWPRLSKSLQELRITGGEPLLSQDFWELIRFIEGGKQENFQFAVNSNLGLSEYHISKLIQASKKINNFHLYTSCESTGPQAEYIRDGLVYERFKQNLERAASDGNFNTINIMMTINALCMFGITHFLDQIFEWKEKYGANLPTFTMNILRFPSFMSVLTLPDQIKESVKHDLKVWYKTNRHNELMLPHEKESIERLITYIHSVQQAHERASSRDKAEKDFKCFFDQYDKRRNKSIKDIFPEDFVKWYSAIESK